MGTTIQDGTGTKLKLKVTNANRALVQAVTITEEDDAITRGEGYQIASGTQSFTGATETGILYVKDLITHLNESDFEWEQKLRSPVFVPENKKIDDLLKEFQESKVHIAVVVDEYGGSSGIVTLEDIIEEIIGDISDEFDDDEISYSKINGTTYIFEGKTPLNDLYRALNIEGDDFEENKGESDTIAGFLIEQAGKILMKIEKLTFGNYTFTIEASDPRKIKQVKVEVKNDD